MFRIEPIDPNFLTKKSARFVCRIPPMQFSFIEMERMQYLKPVDTYLTLHYSYKCQIVAVGNYMHQDLFKSTVTKRFYLVKLLERDCYFLMTEEEQDRYIVKLKQPKRVAEICEN